MQLRTLLQKYNTQQQSKRKTFKAIVYTLEEGKFYYAQRSIFLCTFS